MTPPDDMRVTMADITRHGHCARGARKWFRDYGLDFRAFLRDGISAADLIATGDGMAIQLVRRMMAERTDG